MSKFWTSFFFGHDDFESYLFTFCGLEKPVWPDHVYPPLGGKPIQGLGKVIGGATMDELHEDLYATQNWTFHIHSSKQTWQWKIPIFIHGECIFRRSIFHYSIAMSVYQRVNGQPRNLANILNKKSSALVTMCSNLFFQRKSWTSSHPQKYLTKISNLLEPHSELSFSRKKNLLSRYPSWFQEKSPPKIHPLHKNYHLFSTKRSSPKIIWK